MLVPYFIVLREKETSLVVSEAFRGSWVLSDQSKHSTTFIYTLPGKKYNTQKNGPVPILHPRPSNLSQLPKSKGTFEL